MGPDSDVMPGGEADGTIDDPRITGVNPQATFAELTSRTLFVAPIS
jgi:hypothetical protein